MNTISSQWNESIHMGGQWLPQIMGTQPWIQMESAKHSRAGEKNWRDLAPYQGIKPRQPLRAKKAFSYIHVGLVIHCVNFMTLTKFSSKIPWWQFLFVNDFVCKSSNQFRDKYKRELSLGWDLEIKKLFLWPHLSAFDRRVESDSKGAIRRKPRPFSAKLDLL